MIHIAIVENDFSDVDVLKKLINNWLNEKYLISFFVFNKKDRFIDSILKNDYDVIFLSQSLDDMDCISLARIIIEMGCTSEIILIAHNLDKVLEGYEIRAYRYLLKACEVYGARAICRAKESVQFQTNYKTRHSSSFRRMRISGDCIEP